MSEEGPRPRQVTFAGWLIIGGSVVLVAMAWQRISALHSLEFQEEMRKVLSQPPFSDTGLGFGALQTTVRVLCMVAAGAATASTILGFQALRRSTGARLALTLLAPLVLIGGFATAGFFAPMVVAGIVMLWLQPSRDWFAGRPWLPRASASPGESGPPRPDPFAPAPPRDDPPAALAPPPPPPPAVVQPRPYGEQFGALPPTYAPAPATLERTRRPPALIAACVLVWASTALVSGLMLLFSLVMAVARDDLFDEIHKQQPDFDMKGMSESELATATFVMTAIVVVWCVAAAVLAVLAFRGRAWARVGLAICTGGTGLLVLAATLLSPALVVLLAATAVTLWLLLRPEVTAYFRR
jgi:hypothetical protein